MRIPVHLAALVVLVSGCLGGAGGAPVVHPTPVIVSVPDVIHPAGDSTAIGVSADDAGAALHRAGLRLSITGPFRISSFWGEPIVIRQLPRAHARVFAGTTVRLSIRQEPGTAVCLAIRHVVPDIVGATLERAQRRLGAIAFSVASVPPLPPTSLTRWEDAYRVSSQSIPAGTRIGPCTSVRLRVRLAPAGGG
jgi:beta-lactam-binding protein with PASTA domain